MKLPCQPLIRQLSELSSEYPVVVFTRSGQKKAVGITWVDDVLGGLCGNGMLDEQAGALMTATPERGQALVVVSLPEHVDPSDLRRQSAEAIALLRKHGQIACTVLLSGCDRMAAQVITEGILSANHRFESTGVARDSRIYLETIEFVAALADEAMITEAVRSGWLTSKAALAARDLATEPANILTPPAFVEHCRRQAAQAGFDYQVMGRQELEAAGMGGLLAVASGSRYEPFLVRMDWRPVGASSNESPLVLVGKTVTFDSGGISIKKAQDMDFMKADMGGGAAIFGAMVMVAEIKPNFPITAIFAVVENMPGAHAMRPSDVIRMANGSTVEIINTDAEGRLILADALHYAAGLTPRAVIDLATLTGATLGTFGPIGTAVFANDDTWFEQLVRADSLAGEKVWRMPLWPEYRKFLKSPVADLRHYSTTGQDGSTPVAAAFLEQFIGNHPWLHLDIYNTCWNHQETALMPQGPTGSGARVLAQLILNLAKDAKNEASRA